jgi:hypothetical protein
MEVDDRARSGQGIRSPDGRIGTVRCAGYAGHLVERPGEGSQERSARGPIPRFMS